MSRLNLPDDVTLGDIGYRFVEPGTKVASGAVDVAVDLTVPGWMDDDEIEDAMADAVGERLEFDDEVIEIAGVRVEEVYDE